MEETFKATVTIARPATIMVKKKWYKPAEPMEVTNTEQLVIAGLTGDEAELIQAPFCQKLIGLFTGSHPQSIKVEKE